MNSIALPDHGIFTITNHGGMTFHDVIFLFDFSFINTPNLTSAPYFLTTPLK